MGKDKRSHEKDQKNPGPGYYDIPSTISNLPHYASTHEKKWLFFLYKFSQVKSLKYFLYVIRLVFELIELIKYFELNEYKMKKVM